METKILSRQEKFKRLEESRTILKQEFVGIDNIIDEIIRSVEPWYITPEVIKRPVIISLWGMTGTGKSSIAKRITELLGINQTTLYFDCGKEADSNCRVNDIISSTCDLLGIDVDGVKSSESIGESSVFIFDEFQYARTLDQNGEEMPNANLRCVWKLIDDGTLDITDNYDYDLYKFSEFVDDLEEFAKLHPEIKVKDNMIENPDDVKTVLDNVGCYLYSNREIPSLKKYKISESDDAPGIIREENNDPEEEEEGENSKKRDPYRPLKVMNSYYIRTIVKKLNKLDIEDGFESLQNIFSSRTLLEFCDKIKIVLNRGKTHKYLDCSKSLVFIIGNLDEAFGVEKETNPDVDADMYADITGKVTISDIKEALKRRFRAEQIARIGNNLIKYPTLKKIYFEEIIKKEVSRIVEDFKNNIDDKLDISIEPEIYKLIYVEGVYPTQGVRPIFTTIGSMFTPCFSKIVIERSEEDTSVVIGLKDKNDYIEKDLRIPNTIITITFSTGKVIEYNYDLQLGSLRDPKNRKTRYINSVHESGHAIIMALTTGKSPSSIVAVSTDKGGFCSTYDEDKEGEIDCRQDLDNDIMISLAGYEAEKLIYGDRPEMCLLGSSSDIENAWGEFINAVQCEGYFDPIAYSNYEIQTGPSGEASGIDLQRSKINYNGEEMLVETAMRNKWEDLRVETHKLLLTEKKLIKKLALYLGKHGCMSGDLFMEFVDKFGNNLTRNSMEITRKNNSTNYYYSMLGDE